MGTVYLRTTTAPDGTYQNLATTLTQSQLDNNMVLFLRNDVNDTMSGNLTVTGTISSGGIDVPNRAKAFALNLILG